MTTECSRRPWLSLLSASHRISRVRSAAGAPAFVGAGEMARDSLPVIPVVDYISAPGDTQSRRPNDAGVHSMFDFNQRPIPFTLR